PVGRCDAVRGQPRGHPGIPPPGAREFCDGRAYAGLRADAAAGCRPGVSPGVGFASRSNGGFRMRLKLVALSLFLFAATAWAQDFDTGSVPVTTATLPPFPFFKAPDGLASAVREGEHEVPYDGQYFLAGDKAVLVEGRIFHDKFNLANKARPYTALEFHRNYQDAIAELGGVKINTVQYTPE